MTAQQLLSTNRAFFRDRFLIKRVHTADVSHTRGTVTMQHGVWFVEREWFATPTTDGLGTGSFRRRVTRFGRCFYVETVQHALVKHNARRLRRRVKPLQSGLGQEALFGRWCLTGVEPCIVALPGRRVEQHQRDLLQIRLTRLPDPRRIDRSIGRAAFVGDVSRHRRQRPVAPTRLAPFHNIHRRCMFWQF